MERESEGWPLAVQNYLVKNVSNAEIEEAWFSGLEAVITKQFHPLSMDPGVSFLGFKEFKEQMSKLEVLEAKLPVGLFKADTERNCFCSFFFLQFYVLWLWRKQYLIQRESVFCQIGVSTVNWFLN